MIDEIRKRLEAVREAATAYIDPVGLESDDKWCRLDDALAALEAPVKGEDDDRRED